MNKGYMHFASKILLRVRTQQWTYQYWLLILSMIIMYPTPILSQLKTKMSPAQQAWTDKSIFWLFWAGIYVGPDDTTSLANHAPLYAMLVLLIMEKSAQRWQFNRYGLSLERVTAFKTIEEQLRLIKKNKEPAAVNADGAIARPEPMGEFVTIAEARQECDRVETLFREQSEKIVERRLRTLLEEGVKRKYTIKFRNGMKIVMEQLSLQLLLFSCANKSNLVSVLYLGLLLAFLRVKNKTTGMLYMSYTFGVTLALEYVLSLTNLTSLNNPQQFPAPYAAGYPSQTQPEGEFAFPWFLKVAFLRENLQWAHFFSIDIVGAQVNDIWFDFANLVLLTVYFFNYGNPINARSLKVSFSQTPSLEKALGEYTQIQIENKYRLKFLKEKEEEEEFGAEDFDKRAEKAADNSLEYFLGSTYYLGEIKRKTFIYYFTKQMRCFAFIGLQIVTLLMIFLLAVLCRSLMSIGYLFFCVPLILQITDFFYLDKLHHEKRQWRHPSVVCGSLMIFSFVDIALQVVCQTPFYDGDLYLLRQFGFNKVYRINPDVTFAQLLATPDAWFLRLADGGAPLVLLALKSANLFFIFLQSRVYESAAFWQFVREDLRRLLALAQQYKRMAMTFRYNNWKLQKIVTVQQRKQKMYEGVAELRMKMAHYIRAQQSLIRGEAFPRQPLKEPLLDKIVEEADHHEEDSDQESRPKQAGRQKSIRQLMGKQFSFAHYHDLLRQDDLYFEKKQALKRAKAQIGRCGRWYLGIHKRHVNPILFIGNVEEAQRVKEVMAQGKRKVECDLERTMMQDVDRFFQMRANNTIEKKVRRKIGVKLEEDEIQLKDMPRTREFLRCGNLSLSLVGALLRALFSKSATIAYLFMVLCQVLNAGLVSVLLPFAVFGYALMEECRPGAWFWGVVKLYVIGIIVAKFAINLDFLADDADLVAAYAAANNWLLFGLWRVDSLGGLLVYVLPEFVVLAAIMSQSYHEVLLGLHDKRETELETVEEARTRFLNQFNRDEA